MGLTLNLDAPQVLVRGRRTVRRNADGERGPLERSKDSLPLHGCQIELREHEVLPRLFDYNRPNVFRQFRQPNISPKRQRKVRRQRSERGICARTPGGRHALADGKGFEFSVRHAPMGCDFAAKVFSWLARWG